MSEVWVMAMTDITDMAYLVGADPFALYLASFDPDARRGRGLIATTGDLAYAIRFDSFEAVMATWQTQSTVRPLRDDGKPNRPLAAWTIEPRRIE